MQGLLLQNLRYDHQNIHLNLLLQKPQRKVCDLLAGQTLARMLMLSLIDVRLGFKSVMHFIEKDVKDNPGSDSEPYNQLNYV